MKNITVIGIEQPFRLEILSEAGKKFTVIGSQAITITIKDQSNQIIIPQGFQTDMATIPKVLWSIFPPIGDSSEQYATAAVLHDYLYNTKLFKRKICDRVFLQAMKQRNVGIFVRYGFYLAVRLFGKKYFGV